MRDASVIGQTRDCEVERLVVNLCCDNGPEGNAEDNFSNLENRLVYGSEIKIETYFLKDIDIKDAVSPELVLSSINTEGMVAGSGTGFVFD